MDWILGLLVWLLVSLVAAPLIGTFIHVGMTDLPGPSRS